MEENDLDDHLNGNFPESENETVKARNKKNGARAKGILIDSIKYHNSSHYLVKNC